jgi:hypothetical protein
VSSRLIWWIARSAGIAFSWPRCFTPATVLINQTSYQMLRCQCGSVCGLGLRCHTLCSSSPRRRPQRSSCCWPRRLSSRGRYAPANEGQAVDSVVGRVANQVANLRPIANRTSPRRSFLPPETFPSGTGCRFRGLPVRGPKGRRQKPIACPTSSYTALSAVSNDAVFRADVSLLTCSSSSISWVRSSIRQ